MARGRKPKQGKRHKCGKLMQNQTPEQIATLRSFLASQMPHRTAEVIYLDQRRAINEAKLADERAENPLGRYNLVGAISDVQYQAGIRFRDDVRLYRRVLDIRKERGSIAGFGQPQASTPKEIDDRRAVEIMANYMGAFSAIADDIGGVYGRAAQAAVKHVIILERELAPDAFKYLSMGLSNLIMHYGLTK